MRETEVLKGWRLPTTILQKVARKRDGKTALHNRKHSSAISVIKSHPLRSAASTLPTAREFQQDILRLACVGHLRAM